MHRPELARLATAEGDGLQDLALAVRLDDEEVLVAVAIDVAGGGGAQTVGGARAGIQRQFFAWTGAETAAGLCPAQVGLVAAERPDLERSVGWQRLVGGV